MLERFLSGTLTMGDILTGIAIGTILPSVLPLLGINTPPQPPRRTYGPLAPIQWGTMPGGLTNPGLNPGYLTFGGQPAPFYQPQSQVSSQYYWGMHPYMKTMADLGTYNQVPEAPATPFGIQTPRGRLDVNRLIQQTVGPQAQLAAQGTSAQYAGLPTYATSYTGGAPIQQVQNPMPTQATFAQPQAMPMQAPQMAPSSISAPVSGPVAPTGLTPPPINMNFAPVTVPQNLPEWAPGMYDINQPVAPYGTTPTVAV